MDIYAFIVIGIVVGYLIGSIPFGLIVGKLFYHTDVRKYGSGNLGSTNVTRTLGALPGAVVLILDLLKGGLPAFIMYKIAYNSMSASESLEILNNLKYVSVVYYVTGFYACVGHCHPLFADFKGGKAVASICGFLLFFNIRLGLVGLLTYIIVILIGKIVSIGSIAAAINVMVVSLIPFFKVSYLNGFEITDCKFNLFTFHITCTFLGLLLIYRHLANIKRLLKGEEKKFSITKKGKKEAL